MTTDTTVQRENLTLVEHGLFPIRIHANLTPPALIEHALRRSEGSLTDCGAFTAVTAPHTGRSAKDKFLVDESALTERLWWEQKRPGGHAPGARRRAGEAWCGFVFL